MGVRDFAINDCDLHLHVSVVNIYDVASECSRYLLRDRRWRGGVLFTGVGVGVVAAGVVAGAVGVFVAGAVVL